MPLPELTPPTLPHNLFLIEDDNSCIYTSGHVSSPHCPKSSGTVTAVNHKIWHNHIMCFVCGSYTKNGVPYFEPTADVFRTIDAAIVQVDIPGAKREDTTVKWDAQHGILEICGLVPRLEGEHIVQIPVSDGRKTGNFERSILLSELLRIDKEEIAGTEATSTLENGVLVVTIPVTKKEGEIHNIGIM
ncbi:hypothetical protein H634G_11217 [Metarhizium anisopliae BRIP 53293]|uniref:SHSP domain-containing protein n=1 Tax=Metarhizium anisopliae BRIP 53293 TaxID=1291518 RepID=A0A0D9NI00_METAN|nr:hypothetical protein H634G_11217 [Metarhizium anisopliae BRIP 53293]KJK84956.1 hypothetical protein H633G_11217 [Metarhizium anisopliae BRIP 53284]